MKNQNKARQKKMTVKEKLELMKRIEERNEKRRKEFSEKKTRDDQLKE